MTPKEGDKLTKTDINNGTSGTSLVEYVLISKFWPKKLFDPDEGCEIQLKLVGKSLNNFGKNLSLFTKGKALNQRMPKLLGY